ncbi:MAG TPA: hypothetical protein VLA04_01045 [Verrucomicrobiae bacterium]|nr:hypothetical protein [Verrucomicrobiae bacterium]
MRNLLFGIAVLATASTLGGCGQTVADKQNEEKMNRAQVLMENQPPTQIEYSMDRYLLNQRNSRFNDPNKMSYLYVVLMDGTWLKVTIIGKLTSTSKRLTSPEGQNTVGSYPAPDEMATYGSSDPSRVGMTTMGSLLEFGGYSSFIYSEVPLSFQGLKQPMVEVAVVATPAQRLELLEKLDALKKDRK